MGKVAINNLKTSMVIGADVRDRSGRLLLGSGTELTERHLYILRTWGVVEVEISGAEGDRSDSGAPEPIDPENLAEIEREVAAVFIHTDRDHPAIKELVRMRVIREAKSGKG